MIVLFTCILFPAGLFWYVQSSPRSGNRGVAENQVRMDFGSKVLDLVDHDEVSHRHESPISSLAGAHTLCARS